MNINTFITAAFFCLILCAAARADGQVVHETDFDSAKEDVSDSGSTSSEVDRSSKNFSKTERFLPGEEVVTTTGKKVKVWSTEGPVPVSSAPEPFEDREKTVVDQGSLLIDQRSRRGR